MISSTCKGILISKEFAKFDLWKKNLLDLSRRNKMVFYKPKNKRSIELIKTPMHELFDHLVIQNKSVRFIEVFQALSKNQMAEMAEEELNEYLEQLPGLHGSAIENRATSLPSNHVITNLDDEQLEKNIKNVIKNNNHSIKERGINILYIAFGLLNWFDPVTNSEAHSPLIFVPVTISRKNILNRYEMRITDDELNINESLLQKFRLSVGAEFPEIPEFPDEFNIETLSEYLQEVSDLIRDQKDWFVEERCFIGLFSFSKISLYKDLEKHESALINHELISAIAGKTNLQIDHNLISSISDLQTAPIDYYTILDSDSSQLTAIDYAKNGISMVIHGPPGTGKSQTIANIIAEFLAANKRVLFVAQKAVALDQVKKRLDDNLLGEFCLEVHSHKSNKSEVLSQIMRTIQASIEPQEIDLSIFDNINHIRNRLNSYASEINEEMTSLSDSLYQKVGEYSSLMQVPLIDVEIDSTHELNKDDLFRINDYLVQLNAHKTMFMADDDGTWDELGINNYEMMQPKKTIKFLSKLYENIVEFSDLNVDISNKINMEEPSWRNIAELHKISRNLRDSILLFSKLNDEFLRDYEDIFKVDVYNNDELRLVFEDIKFYYTAISSFIKSKEDLLINYQLFDLDDIERIQRIHEFLQIYLEDSLSINAAENRDFLDNKYQGFFKIFKSGYRNLVKTMKAAREDYESENLSQYLDEIAEFQTDFINKEVIENPNGLADKIEQMLATAEELLEFKKSLNEIVEIRGDTLGDIMKLGKIQLIQSLVSLVTRWITSLNQIESLELTYSKIRNKPTRYLNDIISTKFIGQIENLVIQLERWNQIYTELKSQIIEFKDNFSKRVLNLNSFFEAEFVDFLGSLVANRDELETHLIVVNIKSNLSNLINPLFLDKIKKRKYIKYNFAELFQKAYLHTWITEVVQQLSSVTGFNSDHHLDTIDQFIKLDMESFKINQYRLIKQLFSSKEEMAGSVLASTVQSSELSKLKQEMLKKRNIKPLRTIFSETKNLLTLVKPVFMMSPLSVANYLPGEVFSGFFDVVIFDEASQVLPEDAVGSIFRGKQLIVVGDEKQMPPTRFFVGAVIDDDETDDVYQLESILDEVIGIGLPEINLNWHYRSRKEGLIAFSNKNFYDDNLNTFPDLLKDPQVDAEDVGLLPAIEFIKVDGVYDAGKTRKNRIEAEAIAEAVVNHFLEYANQEKQYSLGIVAFSEAQADAISNAIERLYQQNPLLESITQGINNEDLFIKNLENVQGDERDFIFFSIGYGPTKSGKMGLNFGPINKEDGHRRLNVAITRARYHIKIFCSFNPGEVNLSSSKSKGLRLLFDYLIYARTESTLESSSTLSQMKRKDNLVDSIAEKLMQDSIDTVKFWGKGGYRIDLAVVDPEFPEKFILAIETDGGSYGKTSKSRDRERIRHQVLVGLGWSIYHIWTMNWFKDPQNEIEKIKQLINQIIEERRQKPVVKEETEDIKDWIINYDHGPIKKHLSKKERESPDFRKQLLLIDGINEYIVFDLKDISDEKEMLSDNNKLNQLISEIIRTEGPIHKELMRKRILDYYNISKPGKMVKEKINQVLISEFYGAFPQNQLRICLNPKEDPRKFMHIHDQELTFAITLLIKQSISSKREELLLRVLNLFGINRMAESYSSRLDILLNKLVNKDIIVLSNKMIRLKEVN